MFRGQLMLVLFLIWGVVREIIKTRSQNPKSHREYGDLLAVKRFNLKAKFALANLIFPNKLFVNFQFHSPPNIRQFYVLFH